MSENPISQFIDTYDNEIVAVFDDSFTDSCLIMEIDLENHFSHISNLSNKSCGPYVKYGQQVMELVHKINRELDIKKSTLEDYSRSEKTKIPLRFYNVIKNGETWYERQGFPLDEQEKKQKEVFLGLKTEDILKRYGNRYPPHLVSAIRETYEPVFHKALNQIMNKFDISSLLEPFEEEGYFVTHEKNY